MIVGLTGGIGSGKSTVAKIFSHLGVPVYEADKNSREIIDTDKNIQQRLKQLLGKDVVEKGKVNRPLMASKIFSDQSLLEKVNNIIHPAVGRDFYNWYEKQNYHYVLREAAILFESGSYKDCDKIIVVSAPRELRIKRVMQRNGIGREEVLSRMDKQWPEEEKLKRADFVIKNDHSRSLIKQVLQIHENIIRSTNS